MSKYFILVAMSKYFILILSISQLSLQENIQYILSPNQSNNDAPLFGLTNTINKFNITKNNITANIKSDYPFYNQADGFGIIGTSQLFNRIDYSDNSEIISLSFSEAINITQISLGGFVNDNVVIISVGLQIWYANGVSSSEHVSSITLLNFNPEIMLNPTNTLKIQPFSNSKFSFNSFTIKPHYQDSFQPIPPTTTQTITEPQIESTTAIYVVSNTSDTLTTTYQNISMSQHITTITKVLGNGVESDNSNQSLIIIISVIGCIVIIAIISVIILIVYRLKKNKQKKDTNEIILHGIKINKFENNDIRILDKIGEGNFGQVYKGKWKEIDVALKLIPANNY